MAIKYKDIAEAIEKDIVDGVYKDSKKLPTEEQMMKKYEASRNTIRKAISILVDRGHIYQVQGSGIFIRESSKEGCITLGDMKGLTGDFHSGKVTTKLLELKIIHADEEIANRLKCEIGIEIYFVKRLRFLNGENFAIENSYYNKDIVPYLNKEIVKKSIYDYVINHLKLNIGFADKTIYCDLLDEEHAELLGLKVGEPGIIIEDTVFLTNGLVFNTSKMIYNYKKAKLISLATFR
jgi:GntR family transcriptional regulator of bglA